MQNRGLLSDLEDVDPPIITWLPGKIVQHTTVLLSMAIISTGLLFFGYDMFIFFVWSICAIDG